MEVGANRQSSINLLEPWRCHTTGGCHDDLPIPSQDLTSDDLAQVPRCSAPDPLFEALMGDSTFRKVRHLADMGSPPQRDPGSETRTPPPRFEAPSGFSFSPADGTSSGSSSLDIRRESTPCPPCGVKRIRCLSDVDGLNTADLSVKKRRLRADLITSRLSQPYSQPATHILNREGQEAGDKRFLKMATSVDMTRRIAHLQATSFLRFSTMNCLRKRLSLGQSAAEGKWHEQEIAAITLKATGKSSLRHQSLQDSSAGKSLMISPTGTGITGPSAIIVPRGSPQHQLPPKLFQPSKPTTCRLSNPVALPLPVNDVAATKNRTSPRLFPIRSPELRPTSHLPSLDDLEEDGFAYMHPANDDWDDVGDDQESVYSDFSVLFGQSNEDTGDEEDRSYEEYLDELDGICWMSR
ncbi:hypothetical protein FGRMN_8239 [Fusarium graminum]|nr:hypothetical protein FGRMN_8239 [Fusarium graminum]